ncbi:unnamed protein product, partial [Closterium sp. NIES-54]
MAADTFSAQKRGTAGKSGGKLKADDAMARFVVCRTHDTVLFFRWVVGVSLPFSVRV